MPGTGAAVSRYGGSHQKLRVQIARIVKAGNARCARCGEPIAPGEQWDLGHDDRDRSRYSGPEHLVCNRRTAAHRAEPVRTSRTW